MYELSKHLSMCHLYSPACPHDNLMHIMYVMYLFVLWYLLRRLCEALDIVFRNNVVRLVHSDVLFDRPKTFGKNFNVFCFKKYDVVLLEVLAWNY